MTRLLICTLALPLMALPACQTTQTAEDEGRMENTAQTATITGSPSNFRAKTLQGTDNPPTLTDYQAAAPSEVQMTTEQDISYNQPGMTATMEETTPSNRPRLGSENY